MLTAATVATPTARPAGLTEVEARARLARDGPNTLPAMPPPPAWRQLVAQLVHFFALLLWTAAVLALVAGMPQLAVAIAIIVVVNGLFAFWQEHRAERTAEQLRKLLPRQATVVRDGSPRQVDATQLVCGDVVLLGAGDHVSADMRLADALRLAVDTSTLTGESVPERPEPGSTLYAGTFVVEGEATAEVTATGAQTRLAHIARLSRAGTRPRTPLARELERVARRIAALAISTGVVFLVVSVWLGLPVHEGFLLAIGVSVALVPEGLLPTVTLSLAIGAQRMAHRRALVRRLDAVETLGSTTFICSDKTGTLTCNQMSVVEVWTPHGVARVAGQGYAPEGAVAAPPPLLPALADLAQAAGRCSLGRATLHDGAWIAVGDPMEAAIDALARRLGVSLADDERAHPVQQRIPFDAVRRRTAAVVDGTVCVKGAPESVLPLCADAAGALAVVDDMAHRGLRVLAVAARGLVGGEPPGDLERGLSLLGLLGIQDPPRPGAAEAVAACRAAGIRVAMVTGDHPGTAAAIGSAVGLRLADSPVVSADGLPTDEAELGALIDCDGVILCRVSPEHKLRVARVLQARGHVVAMTGDGVNDGPALHQADIGVAMGQSGTDVAREAADLVLLDDNFATIVAAVEQGRATYANVRRALTYHLTDNVAELAPFLLWALTAGRFPLALGVLQILCLDLGTDQLPALALGVEPPSQAVLKQPPTRRHLFDRALLLRVFGVLGPVQACIELLAFAAVLLAAGWRFGGPPPTPSVLAMASGTAFSAVVFGQAANAFACRSATRWPGALGWTTNRVVLWAVASELALLTLFLFVPEVAALLGQAVPPWWGVMLALFCAPAMLVADAVQKAFGAAARARLRAAPIDAGQRALLRQ